MSGRGGRGGGRGGRGGRGGKRGAPPGLPSGWEYDSNMQVNDSPQERYPKTYNPPLASNHPLSAAESRAVRYLIKFRRDFHNSSLYTHQHLTAESSTSSAIADPVSRPYGQEQMNSRFGSKSKATVDPFLAVPMYSHRFVHEARALPDFRSKTFIKDFFPDELCVTLDGKDGIPTAKSDAKKGIKRKSLAAAAAAGTADALEDDDDDEDNDVQSGRRRRKIIETNEDRKRRIEEAAEKGENEATEGDDVELEEDEGEMTPDDDYEEDEDGGDYDAEQYFDGGEDAGDFDEGGAESAMDF